MAIPDVRDSFPGIDQAFQQESGGRARIASITRRPSEYRTSFVLDEVDILLGNGEVLRLVAKNVARSALTDVARNAKPAFLSHPLREIQVYRELLNPSCLGPPRFHGSLIDEASDTYWLFIERLSGAELYQIGEIDIWKQVARWLAHFHARFESDDALSRAAAAVPLIRYDCEFFRTWRDRALAFSSRWPKQAYDRMRWLEKRYDLVIERLAALPSTVIHGEFYASNVLVEPLPVPTRVAPVDWELAAIGPGLIDLAALTAGSWSEKERLSIANAYFGARDRQKPVDELLDDLRLCRLHLAVQWLGWSDSWIPPREHTHDWLSEAIHLAEEMSL